MTQRVAGVRTLDGAEYRAPRVVLTTGTFLKGVIHIGDKRIPAGRYGEAPAHRALGPPVRPRVSPWAG